MEKRVQEFLGSFPLGVSSGIDPLLLPKTQLAWMVNGTVRGDFVKHRPFFRELQVELVGSANVTFQYPASLFQCSEPYLSADGNTYLMMAVGGRLFKGTTDWDLGTITIEEIDLSAIGLNSSVTPINWMWQSERWLIWNDGVHLPVIFDCDGSGNRVRRSRGPADPRDPIPLLTTLVADLTIPAKNATVVAQVNCATAATAGFTLGQPIIVGEGTNYGTFTVVSLPGTCGGPATDVTGRSLTDPTGAAPSGSTVVDAANNFTRDNNYMGIIHAARTASNVGAPWPVAGTPITINKFKTFNYILIYSDGANFLNAGTPLNAYQPPTQACDILTYTPTIGVGDKVTIGGKLCTVTVVNFTTLPLSTDTFPTPHRSGAQYPVSSIVVTPDANYSGNCSGVVSLVTQHTVQFTVSSASVTLTFPTGSTRTPSTCPDPVTSGAFFYTGLTNAGSISDSFVLSGAFTNWSDIPAYTTGFWPEFTLTLDRNWSGPAASRSNPVLINVPAATVVAGHIQVIGTTPGSNVITCRFHTDLRAAPPNVAVPIFTGGTFPPSPTWVVGTLPTHTTEIVRLSTDTIQPTPFGYDQNVHAVPAAGSSETYNLTVTVPPAVVSPGDVLFFTSDTPATDWTYVTQVGSSLPGTGCCMTLRNITGKEGEIIPATSGIYQIPELPISTIGVYGLGRNWVSLPDFTRFMGSDLVGSTSGTNVAPNFYNFTDAVLYTSQNQGLIQGGTFTIPSSGTKIRAMKFTAVLDKSLGQGPLQVFTDNGVFSCNAPFDITEWANMTSPILTQSLIGAGGVSQTSVVQANGDLIFRSSDGEVRSLLMARLDYNKWGNTPISHEIERLTSRQDMTLIEFCSGCTFDNRMLMTFDPVECPRGVYHDTIAPINFDQISTLQEKQPSVWEGEWNGRKFMRLHSAFFNNVERSLFVTADFNGQTGKYDTLSFGGLLADDPTITIETGWPYPTVIESPVLFSGDGHNYKRLVDAELYFSNIQFPFLGSGITVALEYRADQNPVWTPVGNPQTITTDIQDFVPAYRTRVGFGMPYATVMNAGLNTPMREGYTFQFRITVSGVQATFLGGRFSCDIIPQPAFQYPKS